ncbi:MAG: cysteine--tRNA ligase [Actinobacteria bacterium]|nr:cysteine--tRNA ligase [Actinomycetota bacterium]
MKINNTLTKKKENFNPSDSKTVRMYVCGPTVYNLIHIGNARVYVFFDVVRRYFEHSGYSVKYVSNFTDIDDKIIKRANEEGISFNEVARKYEEEFLKDIDALGLKHADLTPRATEYVNEMIEMIGGLIKKGYAYEAGGDVYFSVEKFPSYGKLSGRSPEEMRAGERVEPSKYKRDPLDFALWKGAKPGEPYWDSPFGPGRPGWHIECSVMSVKLLGFGFDIHGGGQDLIFPHHENEIAQAEAYYGKEPFVRYWMHNGLLTVRSEKMAKSLGNIILLRDALKFYGPDVLKLFYLSTHYRSPLDYSQERIKELEKALKRVLETRKRLAGTGEKTKEITSETGKRLEQKRIWLENEFERAMSDDFNTAKAVAAIFEFIKEVNSALDQASDSLDVSVIKRSKETIDKLLGVLGVDLIRFEEFLQKRIENSKDDILMKLRGTAAYFGIEGDDLEDLILKLIELRNKERRQKNFHRADEIRNKLSSIGVILEDTPQGTRYKIEGA